jgi:hypothetical protein
MPTFQHGKDFIMYIGGYDLTNYFKDWKSSLAVDKADASSAGNAAKFSMPGQRMATWALSGLWDATTGASHARLKAILGTVGTVLTGGWGTDTVGAPCANAIGYGAKYEPGANIGSVVSADAEIECTSGIDYGYTLHEKSASGATNTGYTTVDRGAANTTSGGYAANLQVFSATGTSSPTLSVVVEHSTNGTVWTTLDTFTTVAAASAPTSEQKTGTTSVNRYVRVRWVTTGATSPSFTFHAGLGFR